MEYILLAMLCLIYSKLQEDDTWKGIWFITGIIEGIIGDIIIINKFF